MLRLKWKWKIVFLCFLFLAGSFAFKTYQRIQVGTPNYSGSTSLTGNEGEVQVKYDKWGIPHITAGKETDLYRSLGYVVAKDRLFQMDIHRRLASGRLSEFFGEKTISIDKTFRTLSLKDHSEFLMKNLVIEKQVLANMEAYFDGVNQFIAEKNYPIEYIILGLDPEPFEASDAYAFLGYMAYSFGIGFKVDLLFSELNEKFGAKKTDSLRIEPRGISGERTTSLKNGTSDILEDMFLLTEGLFGVFEGSNAWALRPEKTQGQGAMLASDPHISFSLPGIWYEAHVAHEGWSMYGHFLPLIPFPAMGFNQHIGWGLTISYIDDMDFVREKVEEGINKVWHKDKLVPMDVRDEVIKVKGGEDIEITVYKTPNGPILDPILDEKGISLKWAFYLKSNRAMEGLYKANHARNMDDFKRGIYMGTAPGLNVIYTDRQGNIARFIHGAIPKRKARTNSDLVLDGTNPLDDYDGYFEDFEKPKLVNPSSGIIVSANYRPEQTGPTIHGYWQASDRYETIHELLASKDSWSIEEMKGIQTSPVNINHLKIKNVLISSMQGHFSEPKHKTLLEMFEKWDGLATQDSVGASLYFQWLDEAGRFLLDEMEEELYLRYCRLGAFWHFFKRQINSPNSSWWDIQSSPIKEVRDDILRKGFFKAYNALEAKLGQDINAWHWGKIHTVTYKHPFGQKPGIGEVFNLGPFAAEGGINNINNLRRVGCVDGFDVKAGPSTRRLIDMGDVDLSYGVLPIGNSGHFFSPYFKNQAHLFIGNEFREQYFGEDEINANTEFTFTINPK